MISLRRSLATQTLLATCLLSIAHADAPWPQFRGPNADGRSTETGLSKEWPRGGPKLLWTAKGCGIGYSSVSIGNGLIYTMGVIGEGTFVIALDLDGQRKWRKQIGAADDRSFCSGAYRKYKGTRSTPTICGDRLYVETQVGDVACLNAVTGDEIWSLNMVKEFGARNARWGLSESPLVDGDRLIVCPGGANAGIVALNRNTGETVWVCRETTGVPSYASPVLVDHGGLRQIVTSMERSAVGVHADTGKLLWRVERANRWQVNAPNAIFHDGHIFLSSGYGLGSVLLKLHVDGGQASVTEVWQNRRLDNHHGGVVLVDGYLYGSNMKRQWLCLDFKTGEVMYTERGVGKGSVTYADGMLYCLGESGGPIALVKATPEGHQIVSRFKIPGGRGHVWAHPVVCGGRLYIRYVDQLHAYDVKGH